MTRKQALEMADSGKWRDMSMRERAELQVQQDRLCMPFREFHEAIEHALGRGVFTHEFADRERLKAELFGEREAPTFDDIMQALRDKVGADAP